MPGLAGYINKSRGETNSTLITDMSNILKHHEWYRTDSYTDAKRGLAISHVYLGLTGSPSQPFISPDKQVKILMSGEIYNDDADDDNQLEYIYRQYQIEGADFASKLNGSFNIVVIDEAKDKVIITNASLGDEVKKFMQHQRISLVQFGKG
jgi:asparagine synthetase B (glutamine-hydrolysing)